MGRSFAAESLRLPRKVFMKNHEKFKTFVGESRRVILQTKLNSDWILNSSLIFHLLRRETLNKIWILIQASSCEARRSLPSSLHTRSFSNIKDDAMCGKCYYCHIIHSSFKTTIFISPWRYNSFRQWNEIMQMRIMQIILLYTWVIRNLAVERHRLFLRQNLHVGVVVPMIQLRIQRNVSLHWIFLEKRLKGANQNKIPRPKERREIWF